MQPVINAPEIATAREQQLFNGKNLQVFIYKKNESISGPVSYTKKTLPKTT